MKKLVFTGLSIFFLILNLQWTSAQTEEKTVLHLNIEEAVQYALDHNYDLLNADLDVLAARKRVWETISTGLPQISGSFNYQHIPGEIPIISFSDTMSFPVAVKNTATYSLNVSQLVFSGEYIVGLMATGTYLQLSKSTAEKTELDTKELVMSSYYNILILQSNLGIIDSTINSLESTLRETKIMTKQGFVEQTDYEQIQVTLNTNRNALKALENQLRIAGYLFRIQLGLSGEDEVVLTESLDNIIAGTELEILLNQEFELVQSIEYELAELQVEVSELNMKREKAAFLPSVSAFYTYQDKTNKAVFDFTLNHLIGVNINLPIFSSGQRVSRVKQAQIELEKSENTKIQTGEMLLMNAEQTRLQFRNAWDKYEIQKQNIELSQRIYERTLIRFNEGVSSSMDLNQANIQYLNNYSGYTNAVSEMLNAMLRYKKALNTL